VISIKFDISYEDDELSCRSGIFKLNGSAIETPLIWLGYPIGSSPRLWEVLPMKNLMVNAYEVLKRLKVCEEVSKKGIHEYLGFDDLVFMDSGGFLFQKKDKMDLDPEIILKLYETSKPDIAAVLDHPFDPSRPSRINNRRWLKTLKNTKYMLENNGNILLMPILHGYALKDLKMACREIKKIDENPKFIGLGSLVPLIFNTKGSKRIKDGLKFIVDAVGLIREEFPDSLLHTFGVGSSQSMHFMFALGVDSLDSMGWRLKAAYGVIQLPGVGDRHLTPRNTKKRPFIKGREKELLAACECPACKSKSLEERIQDLNDNFYFRSVHNAWVFLNEQKKFHQALKEGYIKSFIESRLKKGMFSKAVKYVINDQTALQF